MLHCAYAGFAFGKYGSALGLCHILGYCVDDGLAGKVDALYLITIILGRGIECYSEVESCMQSFTEQRETSA